jgi:serine/threonine protein kinase
MSQLRSLLLSPPAHLDFNLPQIPSAFAAYLPRSYLGSGSSSSCVLEVCDSNNKSFALKLYKPDKEDVRLLEIKRLQQLSKVNNSDNKFGIPTVVVDNVAGAILLAPCAKNPVSTNPHFEQLVSLLALVHDQKVCHRDLRSQNIVVDEKNCVWLLDWEKATDFGSTSRGGDYLFSSCSYIRDLADSKEHKATPQDDLHMLVHVAYATLTGKSPSHLQSYTELLDFWSTLEENSVWKHPLLFAQQLNYKALEKFFRDWK